MSKVIGFFLPFFLLLVPAMAAAQMGLGIDAGLNSGVHSNLTNTSWIKDAKVGPIFNLMYIVHNHRIRCRD